MTLKTILHRLAKWVAAKTTQGSFGSGISTPIDAYGRHRAPTQVELIAQLKNTAYTCATINAQVCATFPPKLYVATATGQRKTRLATRALRASELERLRQNKNIQQYIAKAHTVEEVTEHPMLDMFRNNFDLWELTTLYQESVGSAYWLLEYNDLGVPHNAWILPAYMVTPKREDGSTRVIDYFEYTKGTRTEKFGTHEIIYFRYPDPKDPYRSGLSPVRATYENIAMASEYLAFKRTMWDNAGMPSVLISPHDGCGPDERQRLEEKWRQLFHRGGRTGGAMVAEYQMHVDILSHSMGDLAALAEYGATTKDICNAFHVPISFLTSETNLANLQAAREQHRSMAIKPRILRRDDTINRQLVPLFDDSGRLFVVSPDPVPDNEELRLKKMDLELRLGKKAINEWRELDGEPPVEWGDKPWLPGHWIPTDKARANVQIVLIDNQDKPNPGLDASPSIDQQPKDEQ
jgi:HK97 family phage portal protein